MRSTAVFAKIGWFRMVYKPHSLWYNKSGNQFETKLRKCRRKGKRMKKQLLHTYRFVFLCMLIAVVG